MAGLPLRESVDDRELVPDGLSDCGDDLGRETGAGLE